MFSEPIGRRSLIASDSLASMTLALPVSASKATGKLRRAASLPAMTSTGVDLHDVNVSLPDRHPSDDRLVLLGSLAVHPRWIGFLAFTGLNMIQAAFTGWYPAATVFKFLGLRPGHAFR